MPLCLSKASYFDKVKPCQRSDVLVLYPPIHIQIHQNKRHISRADKPINHFHLKLQIKLKPNQEKKKIRNQENEKRAFPTLEAKGNGKKEWQKNGGIERKEGSKGRAVTVSWICVGNDGGRTE